VSVAAVLAVVVGGYLIWRRGQQSAASAKPGNGNADGAAADVESAPPPATGPGAWHALGGGAAAAGMLPSDPWPQNMPRLPAAPLPTGQMVRLPAEAVSPAPNSWPHPGGQ
jgi:hypothetical protein